MSNEFLQEIKKNIFNQELLQLNADISISIENEDGFNKRIDGRISDISDDTLVIQHYVKGWIETIEIPIEDVEDGTVYILYIGK